MERVKLIITGFMGAGKSTLLTSWKADFEGRAFDLDHLVAKAAGVAPDRLGGWIAEVGFDEFRKQESKLIKKFLQKQGRGLLALGGGAFHSENRELWLEQDEVKSLWLDAPLDVLWRRVEKDGNRPLVADGREAFEALYRQRLEDYQSADYRLVSVGELPSFSQWCSDSKLDE